MHMQSLGMLGASFCLTVGRDSTGKLASWVRSGYLCLILFVRLFVRLGT